MDSKPNQYLSQNAFGVLVPPDQSFFIPLAPQQQEGDQIVPRHIAPEKNGHRSSTDGSSTQEYISPYQNKYLPQYGNIIGMGTRYMTPEQTHRGSSMNQGSPYEHRFQPYPTQESRGQYPSASPQPLLHNADSLHPTNTPSTAAFSSSIPAEPNVSDFEVPLTARLNAPQLGTPQLPHHASRPSLYGAINLERDFYSEIDTNGFPDYEEDGAQSKRAMTIKNGKTLYAMVSITVGQQGDHFQFSRQKLCDASIYFSNVLSSNPLLTAVTIPQIDPSLFDIFLVWLTYHDFDASLNTIQLMLVPPTEARKKSIRNRWCQMIELYFVAESLVATCFQNAVLDEVLLLSKVCGEEYGVCVFYLQQVVGYYERAAVYSPLRLLLLDLVAFSISLEAFQGGFGFQGGLGDGFTRDLVVHCLKIARSQNFLEPWNRDWCMYHVGCGGEH